MTEYASAVILDLGLTVDNEFTITAARYVWSSNYKFWSIIDTSSKYCIFLTQRGRIDLDLVDYNHNKLIIEQFTRQATLSLKNQLSILMKHLKKSYQLLK